MAQNATCGGYLSQVNTPHRVILEGTYWAPHQATVVEALVSDPELKKRFGHVSYHLYKPWFKHLVKRNGEKVDPETLSEEETWYALVGTPMTDDEGRSVLRPDVLFGKTHRGRVLEWAEKYGWRVAMTEWNWNGWGGPKNVGKSLTTRGIGAAGFLNAIIRKGGIVELATQSMMVGRGWPFSSVHLKPDPHPHLCGQVTALYSRYHGNQRLFSKTSNVPVRDQLLEWGEIGCSRKVAVLDIVVTSDADALYLHCINRDFEKDYTISPTLDGRPCAGPAVRYTLAGDMSALANAKDCRQSAEIVSETVTGSPLKISLPSKSVSVVVIPLRKD